MSNIRYRLYPQNAEELIRIVLEKTTDYVESYIGQYPEPLVNFVRFVRPAPYIKFNVVVTKAGVSFENVPE